MMYNLWEWMWHFADDISLKLESCEHYNWTLSEYHLAPIIIYVVCMFQDRYISSCLLTKTLIFKDSLNDNIMCVDYCHIYQQIMHIISIVTWIIECQNAPSPLRGHGRVPLIKVIISRVFYEYYVLIEVSCFNLSTYICDIQC